MKRKPSRESEPELLDKEVGESPASEEVKEPEPEAKKPNTDADWCPRCKRPALKSAGKYNCARCRDRF